MKTRSFLLAAAVLGAATFALTGCGVGRGGNGVVVKPGNVALVIICSPRGTPIIEHVLDMSIKFVLTRE